jgi:hypothetical protein
LCDSIAQGNDLRGNSGNFVKFTAIRGASAFVSNLAANQRETEMDRIVLYKGFRIRAYEEWSGLWLAETKKPVERRPGAGDHDDTDAEYIATPSGHPTPEAAIDFIKQMIDSPSTTR